MLLVSLFFSRNNSCVAASSETWTSMNFWSVFGSQKGPERKFFPGSNFLKKLNNDNQEINWKRIMQLQHPGIWDTHAHKWGVHPYPNTCLVHQGKGTTYPRYTNTHRWTALPGSTVALYKCLADSTNQRLLTHTSLPTGHLRPCELDTNSRVEKGLYKVNWEQNRKRVGDRPCTKTIRCQSRRQENGNLCSSCESPVQSWSCWWSGLAHFRWGICFHPLLHTKMQQWSRTGKKINEIARCDYVLWFCKKK